MRHSALAVSYSAEVLRCHKQGEREGNGDPSWARHLRA